MRVANIIPTYNEKENIKLMLEALTRIAKENPQYHFYHIIVDDCSPDGTGQIVKQFARSHKSVYLLSEPKKGLGNALLRGYKYALDELKTDVIIPNDGDFSWDPNKIPLLLNKIEAGYDVVIASRHKSGGQSRGWSWFRKLNHWASNTVFATYIAGIKEVKDHNGNFKAIRVKNVLDKVPLDGILRNTKIQGFAFQPYILYKLSQVTNKFYELPAVFRFRTLGEAKISKKYFKIYFKDMIEYIKLCFLIRIERIMGSNVKRHDN